MPSNPSASERGIPVTDRVSDYIAQGVYLGLLQLMLAETIFPPVPSEVIMSLAGFQVAKRNMDLLPAIVVGSGEAMLGTMA